MAKLAVLTTTRAEYGLLTPLVQELLKVNSFQTELIVSGTHLLEKYGHTIDEIRKDGFPIAHEIPIYGADYVSDEFHATMAVAKAVQKSGEFFSNESYDALVVLGDRYELLGFCSAAVICRLPIIHIHGGEITEGAIDDKIRHAITKLASIHFPSVREYADRIIQMGEDPKRVFPVGALGIDNAMRLNLLSRMELLQELGINTDYPIAAVTYHPVTGENPENASREMEAVLSALYKSNVFSVVTMPNSDVGGDEIFRIIKKYENCYPDRFVLKKSLGQLRYLSLLKHSDIMVGNSSSGILESASFGLPTIDIGDRQKGRMAPRNVVHVNCNTEEIKQAISECLRKEKRESLRGYVNPYGDGDTAKRIVTILKGIDLTDRSLICKPFRTAG